MKKTFNPLVTSTLFITLSACTLLLTPPTYAGGGNGAADENKIEPEYTATLKCKSPASALITKSAILDIAIEQISKFIVRRLSLIHI